MSKKTIWTLGILATVIGCIIPFVPQKENDLTFTVIIATIGIILTTLIEMRIKVIEIEEGSLNAITEIERNKRIYDYGSKDRLFTQKLISLKEKSMILPRARIIFQP